MVDPMVVDPSVVDPSVVDPSVVDPSVVDPSVVDPSVVDQELPGEGGRQLPQGQDPECGHHPQLAGRGGHQLLL